jgi:hypothetical protein
MNGRHPLAGASPPVRGSHRVPPKFPNTYLMALLFLLARLCTIIEQRSCQFSHSSGSSQNIKVNQICFVCSVTGGGPVMILGCHGVYLVYDMRSPKQ